MKSLASRLRACAVSSRYFLLLLTVCSAQGANAFPALWEADFIDVELNGAGPNIGGGPSSSFAGASENTALGFDFPFGGNTYSHIIVDTHGSIILTNSATLVEPMAPNIWNKAVFQPAFTNRGSGSPAPILLPFNAEMNQFDTGGKTYFKQFNDSGNTTLNNFTGNRAVITWINSNHYSSAGHLSDISFQAQLLDDGTIIFGYSAITSVSTWNSMSQGIVIGVSNGDGPTLPSSQDLNAGGLGIDLTGYQVWCKDENPNSPVDCIQAGLDTNNAFDLDDTSIVFNPDGDSKFLVSDTVEDGSGQGGSGMCEVPTQDVPAGPLLWDDDYKLLATELNGGNLNIGGGPSGTLAGTESVSLGFNFPYGGTTYNRIIVDNNGAILLTNDAAFITAMPATIWTASSFVPFFTNFGSGSPAPVLLPFSSSLDQFNTLGKTYFKQTNDSFAGVSGNRAIITWEDSTFDGSFTIDLNLQVILLENGTIIFSYDAVSDISQWDSRSPQGIVVGISNGDGVFPLGSQNFSSYDVGSDLTAYQIWCRDDDPTNPVNCAESGLDNNDGFDLDGRSLVFNPDGSSGFLISSSIKDGNGNGGSDVCANPPTSQPPVAVDDFLTTGVTEDITYFSVADLDANDSDPDGDSLSVTAGSFSTVQGGTIDINSDGSFSYLSALDFNGSDSFVYTLNAGGQSDTATVFITVGPASDPPVANDDLVTAGITENVTYFSVTDLDANDSDADGDSLTVTAGSFTTVQNGTININSDGSYSYIPALNFSGNDGYVYTLNAGGESDTATVFFVVAPAANNAPVAVDDFVASGVIEDITYFSVVDLDANDSDPDGDPLTVTAGSFSTVQGGTINISSDGSYSYISAFNFNGSDSYIYTLNGGGQSDTGTVNFTVAPADDPPVAVDDIIDNGVIEDVTFFSLTDLDANDSDIDGDALTVTAGNFTTLLGGTINISSDGSYSYLSAPNYNGGDSYTYTLNAGGQSTTATVYFIVAPAGDTPIANDDFVPTGVTEDIEYFSVVDLDANDFDADGDPLSVRSGSFTTVQGGTININSDGSYSYISALNYNGSDSYVYRLKAGGQNDNGTVHFTVAPANDAPEAETDTITATPGITFVSSVDLDANDTDVDDSVLTVVAGTFATDQSGSITIASDGSFAYTPPAGFIGSDGVNYTVTDGLLNDLGRLHIIVASASYSTATTVLDELKSLKKKSAIKNHARSKKYMNNAVKHMKSLVEALESGNLGKAMKQISNALSDLRKVKKKKSVIIPLMEQLADSSKNEAQAAIDVAIAAVGNPTLIAEAQTLMNSAQAHRNNDRPDKAAKDYEAAWVAAQEAIL